jgi:hypothetical protein
VSELVGHMIGGQLDAIDNDRLRASQLFDWQARRLGNRLANFQTTFEHDFRGHPHLDNDFRGHPQISLTNIDAAWKMRRSAPAVTRPPPVREGGLHQFINYHQQRNPDAAAKQAEQLKAAELVKRGAPS